MQLQQKIELPYTPRAIALDSERDLLMVADWFGGAVHFYQLLASDPVQLREIGAPVDIGPYVRDFAYDRAGGRLFTASKCGVYEINLAAVGFDEPHRSRLGF